MKPETFERIRAGILAHLRKVNGPVRVSSLEWVANTKAHLAREVRLALEQAGVVRTFKDMDLRNHPMFVELITPEIRQTITEQVPLDNAMVTIRTAHRTLVLSAVTGVAQLAPDAEGYRLQLSGIAPGYITLPNAPVPTDQKEG